MHRIVGACVAGVVVCALIAAGGAGAASCPGRALVNCYEKTEVFNDEVTWFHAFELDIEPFEISAPFRLGNPALGQFWRFETSTAAARAFYELEFGYEYGDPNFEQAASPPALPKPVVYAHGVVDRRLARKLSRLMQAEQSEVTNLEALDTSLDRATEASADRTRSDWVAWQMWLAAGYANRAAGAISNVIADQRVATKSLVSHGLLYGVGSADLSFAQQHVRARGINPSVLGVMQQFGLADQTSKFVQALEQANFGSLSFSLSQFFSQQSTITAEQNFQAALKELAGRIPEAAQPQ